MKGDRERGKDGRGLRGRELMKSGEEKKDMDGSGSGEGEEEG